MEDRGAFIHVELAGGRFRVRIADDLDEESLLRLPKSLRQLGNLAELRPEPA